MKEIRELHLSEFQKEIINKLDDKYFYEISGSNWNIMYIYKTENNQHLTTITDEYKSELINDRLEIIKNKNEESLKRNFELVKENEKIIKENEEIIKMFEIILEENK